MEMFRVCNCVFSNDGRHLRFRFPMLFLPLYPALRSVRALRRSGGLCGFSRIHVFEAHTVTSAISTTSTQLPVQDAEVGKKRDKPDEVEVKEEDEEKPEKKKKKKRKSMDGDGDATMEVDDDEEENGKAKKAAKKDKKEKKEKKEKKVKKAKSEDAD